MIFSIATCPNCDVIQTIQINDINQAILRCVSCSKQTKIQKVDGTMVKLHGFFDRPSMASKVCMKMKENSGEFKSALKK